MTLVKEKMRVLCLTTYYLPGYKGGGPIKTIKNIAEQLGDDIAFSVVASDRDLGDSAPYVSVDLGKWVRVGKAFVFYAPSGFKFYRQVAKLIWMKDYDLVYLNSFFSLRFSLFPLLLAKAFRKRVLLAPRGEFSEGALSMKRLKKILFIRVSRILGVHAKLVFQASSIFEVEDIRRVLGQEADIKVAENIGAQEFASDLPIRSTGPLKAVFVSRISPKKNLLAALEILKKARQPLDYHLYGPIEDGQYWEQCREAISALPAHIKVEHKGTLIPDQVISTLAEYDVFFLPTKGENYGHVIAEALCAALPVVISDATPWRNLQQLGIGWDLPLSKPDAFSSVLDKLALMPAEQYQDMRACVLGWARNKFSQQDTTEANIAMFRYVYEKSKVDQ